MVFAMLFMQRWGKASRALEPLRQITFSLANLKGFRKILQNKCLSNLNRSLWAIT